MRPCCNLYSPSPLVKNECRHVSPAVQTVPLSQSSCPVVRLSQLSGYPYPLSRSVGSEGSRKGGGAAGRGGGGATGRHSRHLVPPLSSTPTTERLSTATATVSSRSKPRLSGAGAESGEQSGEAGFRRYVVRSGELRKLGSNYFRVRSCHQFKYMLDEKFISKSCFTSIPTPSIGSGTGGTGAPCPLKCTLCLELFRHQ